MNAKNASSIGINTTIKIGWRDTLNHECFKLA